MNTYDAERARRAHKIVRNFEDIQKLKRNIDFALKEIKDLLVQDGQPSYELKRIEDYRTVVGYTLKRELAADQTAWEGYAQARDEVR